MSDAARPILIGNLISPYVRKVLTVCALKGVEVEIDVITPFLANDEFVRLNPLRRIPVWLERDLTLCDSSVIVQYLEETRGGPALWPDDPDRRAEARWIEEYGDTRLSDVFIWRLFYQLSIRRRLFDEAPDATVVDKARETEWPEVLDYLEARTPEAGFLFGKVSIADLSIAPAFLNARMVKMEPDPERWPRLAAWLERVETETPLGRLNAAALTLIRLPLAEHKGRMADFGLIASPRSWGREGVPTRGPMTVI